MFNGSRKETWDHTTLLIQAQGNKDFKHPYRSAFAKESQLNLQNEIDREIAKAKWLKMCGNQGKQID